MSSNHTYQIGDKVTYNTLAGHPVTATVTAIYDRWRGIPGETRIEISWEAGRYATVKPDQIKPLAKGNQPHEN